MENKMWIKEIKLMNFRNYDEQKIKLHENINVFFPSLAAASPASHPACPAPITATSYSPA